MAEEEKEVEGSRKRQWTGCEYGAAENNTFKKPRTPARNENADDDDGQEQQDVLAAWLTLDDDTVMELSELLDSSEAPFDFKVKFIDDPYVSPEIFQSSSAYVTINGNEESCGSSFSDSESSVMASVDMGSFRRVVRKLNADGGGAWGSGAGEEAREWVEESDYVEGIFVKSLRGCALFETTSPPSGYNYENESVNGDGDDEMWVNFLGEDLLGAAW